jgi:hypothetical protein
VGETPWKFESSRPHQNPVGPPVGVWGWFGIFTTENTESHGIARRFFTLTPRIIISNSECIYRFLLMPVLVRSLRATPRLSVCTVVKIQNRGRAAFGDYRAIAAANQAVAVHNTNNARFAFGVKAGATASGASG